MSNSCSGISEKSGNRIAWIDIAKALAMTLIVFGHIDVESYAQDFVYTFHVPVFIFLSGYCFSSKDRFTVFLKKKLLRIMVPYGFFGLFAIGAYFLIGRFVSDRSTRSVAQCLYGLISGNAKTNDMVFNLHLWFLPCLFMMCVIFYGLKKLADMITEKTGASEIYGAVGLFVLTMIASVLTVNCKTNIFLPFSTEIAISNLPFFSLGFLMKVSGKISSDADRKNKKQMLVLAVLFVVFAAALAFFAHKNITHIPNELFMVLYHIEQYGVPVLFYAAAFSGIGAVVCLARLLPAFRCIAYYGRNTLAVLVMQKFFTIPVRMIIERLPQKQIILVPAYAVSTVAVILMCLAANWVIKKYFPFLYGLPYKKRRIK